MWCQVAHRTPCLTFTPDTRLSQVPTEAGASILFSFGKPSHQKDFPDFYQSFLEYIEHLPNDPRILA